MDPLRSFSQLTANGGPRPARSPALDRVELRGESEQPPALAAALMRAGKPYYDARADQEAQRRYYGNFNSQGSPQDVYRRLSELVTKTHTTHRGYEPAEYLYGWVDLRPNLRLKCIYDPNPVAVDAPVRGLPEDFKIKVPVGEIEVKKRGKLRKVTRYENRSLEQQAAQWVQALKQGPTNAVELARRIAEIEVRSTFNCEHVIPRIWFGDRAPMRGDLHHLFTANQDTNSQRSSRRLVDFPEYDGADGKGYAPYHDNRYEPAAGKGAVARATLYFLLRYPCKVGDDPREIQPEDLKTLLEWHRSDPPGLYERHRNAAIAELQGNRNPFIDHPEWADRIDFTRGIGPSVPERHLRAKRQAQKSNQSQQQQRPYHQGSRRNRKNRGWQQQSHKFRRR